MIKRQFTNLHLLMLAKEMVTMSLKENNALGRVYEWVAPDTISSSVI